MASTCIIDACFSDVKTPLPLAGGGVFVSQSRQEILRRGESYLFFLAKRTTTQIAKMMLRVRRIVIAIPRKQDIEQKRRWGALEKRRGIDWHLQYEQ